MRTMFETSKKSLNYNMIFGMIKVNRKGINNEKNSKNSPLEKYVQ